MSRRTAGQLHHPQADVVQVMSFPYLENGTMALKIGCFVLCLLSVCACVRAFVCVCVCVRERERESVCLLN